MPTPFKCTNCSELKDKIKWLENGLEEIKNITKDLGIQILAQSILDGESTTADEYNDAVELAKLKYHNDDHMLQDEILEYKDNMSERKISEKNTVRISDINKEIAKEMADEAQNKVDQRSFEDYHNNVKDTMQEDEKAIYEDEHICKHGNSKASNCSDCEREELEDKYRKRKTVTINDIIRSVGYRGDD